MNRHERRKAKTLRAEVVTIGPEEAQTILDRPLACAWGGCAAHFKGPMPYGWRNLLVFWSRGPIMQITDIPGGTWDRDGVLCPQHAQDLDDLLINIVVPLKGPIAGSA